jgi:hypothetical protein
MQNVINFFKEFIMLIILSKVFRFFLTGKLRSSKHGIATHLARLIGKTFLFCIIGLEEKLDSKMAKSHQSRTSNVIPFKSKAKH